MNWTDERVEILTKLWKEGLSASQIAKHLGGVSRNAVVGKVHRLGLSSRGRAVAAPARQKKVAPEAKKVTAAKALVVPQPETTMISAIPLTFSSAVLFPCDEELLRPIPENVVVPISRRLKLAELTDRTCKWPNGDPLNDDFNFCGNDAAETGPYCKYHAKLAFQPVSERRRSR